MKNRIFTTLLTLIMAGNSLLADWQPTPTEIKPIQYRGGVLDTSLAYNDNGIGLLVGYTNFSDQTSAFRFNGTSWDPPVTLQAGFSSSSVALNSTSGLAVFNSSGVIGASRYNATTDTWFDTLGSTVELFSFGTYPQVAIGPQGNGIAAFIDSNTGRAFASQYDATTTTWSDTGLSAVQLSPNLSSVQAVKIAMDANGNGLAIWNNASGDYVQASNYNGTTKLWSNTQASAINLSLNDVVNGSTCALAMNPTGTALAVWISDPGSGNVVESAWYNGTTWQFTGASALVISTPGVFNTPVSVTMDDAGNGFAIWSFLDGTNYVAQAARFDATTQTWGTPVTLSLPGNIINNLTISASGSGNVLAGWIINDGTETVAQSSLYNATTQSWENTLSQASLISDPEESASNLVIVANQTNALAYFSQGNYPFAGSFSNLYTFPLPPPVIPPANGSNFIGTLQKNKFLTQTDNIHILTWSASLDPSVIGYYVRANGVLIANIPATSPLEVVLHNQNPKFPTMYVLTAYNASNVESAPLNFLIK